MRWGSGGPGTAVKETAFRPLLYPTFPAAALVIRLFYLPFLELIPEEAYYWQYAQNLAWSYLDHPPLVGWLIYLSTRIFGVNEFGVRIGASICWLVGVLFVYKLTLKMSGRDALWIALGLYAVLPYFFGASFFISPDAPLMACWAAVLYYFYRALIEKQSLAFLAAGLFGGLGMLSKYTILFLALAALVYMVLDRESRRWFKRSAPYAGALLAVLLFTPVLLWNAEHNWASFAFQGARRLQSSLRCSLHLYLLNAVYLVTPIGVLAAGWLFWLWRRAPLPARPEEKEEKRRRLFVLLFFWLPFGVFALYSLRHVPKLNWAGPSFLVLLPALAFQVAAVPAGRMEKWLGRLWVATLGILLFLYLITFHYASFGLPGIGYSPRMQRFIGWRSLAEQVYDLALRLPEASVIVGMDKHNIASELAFYIQILALKRGRQTELVSGRHLFGRESLMHKYWTSSKALQGKTLIMVARKETDLETQSLAGFFARLGPLKRIETTHNFKAVGTFFYRLGYVYRPPVS